MEPPPPPPAIQVKVFRLVNNQREDTQGIVSENTPVVIGFMMLEPRRPLHARAEGPPGQRGRRPLAPRIEAPALPSLYSMFGLSRYPFRMLAQVCGTRERHS